MKDVIMCGSCSSAAVKPHVGFFGEDEVWCTCFGMRVDRDDG